MIYFTAQGTTDYLLINNLKLSILKTQATYIKKQISSIYPMYIAKQGLQSLITILQTDISQNVFIISQMCSLHEITFKQN